MHATYAGCPYKNWDISHLRAAMGRLKLAAPAVDSVIEAVRNKEFQLACRRQFEGRFPGADSGPVGNHPNAYAEAANAFLRAGAAAGAAGGAGAGAGAGGAGAADAPSSPKTFAAASAAVAGAGAGAAPAVAAAAADA